MVRSPFTEHASFDFDLLRAVVRVLQRALDNVWDVTNFPLEEQREECLAKRRTGLGFTGLADVFAQMGYRYGSPASADLAERITQVIAEEAYNTSVDLAIEKGPFPLFDADRYLAPNTFAGSRLPRDIQDRIRQHGIRNGVLLTIAPTGTSSIVFGNPQGGLEPFFALRQVRKVLQPDGTKKPYVNAPYAISLWAKLNGVDLADEGVELPSHLNAVMTGNVTVDDHILIQARCQRWVDASISKTTNIPKDMPYEEFVRVYDLAYANGCKGCTTYRPSDVRGSVLEDASAKSGTSNANNDVAGSQVAVNLLGTDSVRERPDILEGKTYKIKWPRRDSSIYLTINSDVDGRPFEIFLTGKDGTSSEWMMALSLMITGIFRKGGNVSFVAEELKQIQSVNDGNFMKLPGAAKGTFIPSLPAYIGHILEHHMLWVNKTTATIQADIDKMVSVLQDKDVPGPYVASINWSGDVDYGGNQCPKCKHPSSLIKAEGCDNCMECGYSKCG
jgi:ribonucleoside-diphosphate reductase alpha chain